MLIYNLLLILGGIFSAPYFLLKMMTTERYRKGLGQRFAVYRSDLLARRTDKPLIWVHAASVGEVMAARPLVAEIRSKFPDHQILFSTITAAGNKLCKETAGVDIVIYFPLDFFPFARKAVRTFAPSMLIIVETELWPNFISTAAKSIPIFLVNGRISDRSFPRYRLFRKFTSPILRKFSGIIMQDRTGQKRAIALGADPAKVYVAGSLKYDSAARLKHDLQQASAIRSRLGFGPHQQIIVGGCTHPGEEKILIDIYLSLKKEMSDLALILAPRHLKRLPEVENLLKNNGLSFARYSRLTENSPSPQYVVVIDLFGTLADIYQTASVIFIGKSLTRSGGHNPNEAAALSKPIIFGPHMENFAETARALLKNNAAIQVETPAQLKSAIKNLLEDNEYAQDLGTSARRSIDLQTGATAKTIKIIEEALFNRK